MCSILKSRLFSGLQETASSVCFAKDYTISLLIKMETCLRMVCVVWLLAVSLPVQAGESMRCGSNLIMSGNTKFDVLKNAGNRTILR